MIIPSFNDLQEFCESKTCQVEEQNYSEFYMLFIQQQNLNYVTPYLSPLGITSI